jgi:hypothetical protein
MISWDAFSDASSKIKKDSHAAEAASLVIHKLSSVVAEGPRYGERAPEIRSIRDG